MSQLTQDEKDYIAEQDAAAAAADRAYAESLPSIALSAYPQRIARLGLLVNQLELDIARTKRLIAAIECKADQVVAFDATLKNEGQRTCKRQEMLAPHPDYADLQESLMADTKALADLKTEQECERGEFSIAKLGARARIAELLNAEVREFAGL